jgi:hypothetical protein
MSGRSGEEGEGATRMSVKVKSEVKLYTNAVHAFGGARLTIRDLLLLIERDNIPSTASLIGSADEEGNRYGPIFELHSEKLTKKAAQDMEIPEFAGTNVVIFTPAI